MSFVDIDSETGLGADLTLRVLVLPGELHRGLAVGVRDARQRPLGAFLLHPLGRFLCPLGRMLERHLLPPRCV